MGTLWQSASGNCKHCQIKVADLKVENGKISIISRTDSWGTLVQAPGRSIMAAICRKCQKKHQ
jgi:hypothetical protein